MEDIIKDTIIVRKMDITFKEIEEGLIKDGHFEKEQIAAEYEDIVKKQLQMLQVDERGRQALQKEIAEIRIRQEMRAELLKMRAKALKIEKDRAKRIASRPPPLPRSVRLLLKEQAKKDIEMANEFVTSNISPSEEILQENMENKENIDEELLAEKQKMQEEWDKKAKKRFNEALKKDRQKQEHDTILKEIEDAEKLNRRQMARNISEPMGKLPCYLPDKLHHSEKQVAMEDAVEDIFKKKNPREHAVEDLEGYQDKWETKYQQIDSVMESRMIDCVPSFVKNNYSYLLQDETTLRCGKHFSGLDDNTDLNEAYIEAPPADLLNNSKEIDAVISQLDQMRVELNEAYEKEFKPLLKAGVPKVVSIDKSVEANILKIPTEDKAIEVERTPPKSDIPLSSSGIQANTLQGGVMSFQRRDLGKMYRSHSNNSDRYLPESFASQLDTALELTRPSAGLESWSSSSYWSLPSKHGLPKFCKFCDSPGCNTPLVEDKRLHKDCVPLRKNVSKPCDDLTTKFLPATNDSTDEYIKSKFSATNEPHSSSIKTQLKSYIQLVADKYLKKSTNSPKAVAATKGIFDTSSKADSKEPIAFSNIKISEFTETDKRIADTSLGQRPWFPRQGEVEISVHNLDEAGQNESGSLKYNLHENSDISLIKSSSPSEDNLLQDDHKIIPANILDAFSSNNISAEVSCSPNQSINADEVTDLHYKKESLTGYVYHDLSTIPEMDSILTNDTKELFLNETPGTLEKNHKKSEFEDILPVDIDTTSASLVDAPVSAVSEIAKSIQFIRKSTLDPLEIDDANKEHITHISGTLTDFETLPSVVSKVQSAKYKISSIKSLSDDQVSNFDSSIDAKVPDSIPGSSGLLTPSPVSTLKSVSKSQGYPYSSSYRDLNTTRSHLTSTSALSKYFQDISSIRQYSETPFKNSIKAAISVQPGTRSQTEMHSSSSDTFLPMTPHSYVSTQRQTELYENSSSTFLPMTPQSYLSTPGDNTQKQTEQNSSKMFPSSFKSRNVLEVFETPESNTGSFKALTPLSYFSSNSKTTSEHPLLNAKSFSPRKDSHYSFHNNDKGNARYQHETTSNSNFQAMTPHTYLSSPNDIHTSGYNRLDEFSIANKIKKGSVNVSIRVPNPFKNKVYSQNHKKQEETNDPKRFTYPIQLRLDVKDITNSFDNSVTNEPPIQQDLSMNNLKKVNPSFYADVMNAAVKCIRNNKEAVKIPSSGFVPQLTIEDLTLSEKNKKETCTTEIPASAKNDSESNGNFSTKSPIKFLCSANNDKLFSSGKNSVKSSINNNDVKKFHGKVSTTTSLVENERGYSTPAYGEGSSTLPNPILQPSAQIISSANLHMPCGTLSSGSSVESLSEMFADSKITYQSTPIKSIEELIQETGILEEPSLTLMNTEITIKPDSPGKSTLLSESCSDNLKTPSSLESAFSTPKILDTPSDATSSPNCCDSPSMISFLMHEQSCLTSVNPEENKSSTKKKSQNDYKKRTKRLWNNLEEVRTKKLLEEKREQMKTNRLKMKSYSKNSSPLGKK